MDMSNAREMADDGQKMAGDAVKSVKQSVNQGVETMKRYATQAKEVAGEYGDKAKDMAKQAKDKAQVQIQDNPFYAMLIALGVGVTIGCLLSSATRK